MASTTPANSPFGSIARYRAAKAAHEKEAAGKAAEPLSSKPTRGGNNGGGFNAHNGTLHGLIPRKSGITINQGEFTAANGAAVHTATARGNAHTNGAATQAAQAAKLHPVTDKPRHTGAYSKASRSAEA